MRSHTRRTALLAALLCLLLVGSVAPSFASPQPQSICAACGEGFERAAAGDDVDPTVSHSVATVEVHENGSATWTVENRVDRGAAATFRADQLLLDVVARRAVRTDRSIEATVAAERPVVTLRWRQVDFATRTLGGTLVTKEFHGDWAKRHTDGLGSDRLIVVAPESMRVDRAVDGATVEGDGRRRMVLTEYDSDDATLVTFVPRTVQSHPAPTVLAIAQLTARVFAENALLFVGAPLAVFAASTAGVTLWLRRAGLAAGESLSVTDRTGYPVAAVGVLLVGCSTAASGASVALGAVAPLLGAGVGLLTLAGVLAFGDSRSATGHGRPAYRRVLSVALSAAGVGVGAVVLLSYAGGDSVRWSFSALPWVVPVLALVPAGHALGRGRIRLAVGTAVAGFAVALLAMAPLMTPANAGDYLRLVIGVGAAVGFAPSGVPLLVAGASLHAEQRTPVGAGRTGD